MNRKIIIGKRLKELREKAKMSQGDVAKELNLTQSAIAQYEMGRNCPNEDILVWYADRFNSTLDYIFGRTNANTTQYDPNDFQEGSKNYDSLKGIVEQIVKNIK